MLHNIAVIFSGEKCPVSTAFLKINFIKFQKKKNIKYKITKRGGKIGAANLGIRKGKRLKNHKKRRKIDFQVSSLQVHMYIVK